LNLHNQQRLGWSPKTPFEEALAITYDYLKETLE